MPEVVQQVPQAELPLATPAAAPAAPKKGRFELPPDPVPAAPAAESATPVAQKPEEQAPQTEPEVKPEEEPTPDQAVKRESRRFERRIDKLHRERAEARARAELLQAENERLKQATSPKAPDGAPTLEQFDFDPEKYAAAKAEFAKQQAVKEYEAKQRAESETRAKQSLLTAWEEKATKAEDKYDDFAEKVGDLQPDSAFAVAIMEAENAGEVAYYLGTHPKEAQRIAQLSPLSQAREIGKLEAKLLSEPVTPKAPSKAPAPITPLTATQPVVDQQPSENDSMRDWIRKREKHLRGR